MVTENRSFSWNNIFSMFKAFSKLIMTERESLKAMKEWRMVRWWLSDRPMTILDCSLAPEYLLSGQTKTIYICKTDFICMTDFYMFSKFIHVLIESWVFSLSCIFPYRSWWAYWKSQGPKLWSLWWVHHYMYNWLLYVL